MTQRIAAAKPANAFAKVTAKYFVAATAKWAKTPKFAAVVPLGSDLAFPNPETAYNFQKLE